MTTQRHRNGKQLSGLGDRDPANNRSARQFPTLQQIQELQKGLDALNERIAELEKEGHHGHAIDVLKTNAVDFACRIDELRSLSADKRLSKT